MERKMSRSLIWGIAGIVLLCLLMPAVSASTRTYIFTGADVFIGEQGLDISNAMYGGDTQIAWWASGSNPMTDAPGKIVTIANPLNFYVAPSDFVGYSGNWYSFNGTGPSWVAFGVSDPYLAPVQIWDEDTATFVTDGSVSRGDHLVLNVSTNMYSVFVTGGNRYSVGGDVDENIDLKVRDPTGTVYTTLFDTSITQWALTGQMVDANPWATGRWFTGAQSLGPYDYTPGTYTVWAESTLNSMRLNYKNAGADYTGKTVSSPTTVAIINSTVATAVQNIITSELHGVTTGVTVSAYPQTVPGPNTLVNLWGNEFIQFTNAGECSLVAVDHAPEANWEHPITYYCVDATGSFEKKSVSSPATNYRFLYNEGKKPSPGDAWQPDDPYVWNQACVNDCTGNYAVLISGGNDANNNYRRYWNDIAFMYINLKEYGYDRTHITVMMSDGSGPGADRCIAGYPCTQTDDSPRDLDGDGSNETVLDASKTTILNTLDSMKPAAAGGTNPLPSGANLIVFTTGHGGVVTSGANAGHHIIYAWGGTGTGQYILDTELVAKLNQLTQVNSIMLVMENCNSGGFKDEFIGSLPTQKRKILYAASGDEPSWGNGFSNALTTAYAGHTRWYTRSCLPSTCMAEYDKGADTSSPKDERVSATEAIARAKLKDPYFTATAGAVPGKEHSDMVMNTLAAADSSSLYLSSCTGAATQSITVRNPANGENWARETTRLINWEAQGLTGRKVIITLYKSGVFDRAIVALPGVSATDPMYYPWTVPADLATSTTNIYTIRVQTADTPTVTGTSGSFRISIKPAASGQLKIITKDETGTYLAVPYTVSRVTDGAVVASGTTPATSVGSTTPALSPGTYKALLNLNGYYPIPATVYIGPGITTKTYTLIAIPSGANADAPPFGGVDVSSGPDGATILVKKTTDAAWMDTGVETNSVVYLPPADYDIKVIKAGYLDSVIQTVTVETLTPMRMPVKVSFELTSSSVFLSPEFPSVVLPAAMIIGLVGAVLFIRRTREH
jgi:Domain of unknown function (DUF3821)/Peptidase C13 family